MRWIVSYSAEWGAEKRHWWQWWWFHAVYGSLPFWYVNVKHLQWHWSVSWFTGRCAPRVVGRAFVVVVLWSSVERFSLLLVIHIWFLTDSGTLLNRPEQFRPEFYVSQVGSWVLFLVMSESMTGWRVRLLDEDVVQCSTISDTHNVTRLCDQIVIALLRFHIMRSYITGDSPILLSDGLFSGKFFSNWLVFSGHNGTRFCDRFPALRTESLDIIYLSSTHMRRLSELDKILIARLVVSIFRLLHRSYWYHMPA